MKNKIIAILMSLFLTVLLSSCGNDEVSEKAASEAGKTLKKWQEQNK